MAKHAKLSASGSAKWLNCPGSISLESGLPNPSSEFAAEGTAAHELATWCLTDKVPALNFLGNIIHVEGFKFEVTHEMVEAVQTYVDYCNDLEGDYEWVEEKVEFTNWVPDGFGTADHIKIQILKDKDVEHHIINVTDFKYGKGVRVSADHNSQGMLYALGVFQSLSHLFAFDYPDIINITIVQPRLDHIDTFKISIKDLWTWAGTVVKPKAEEALSNNPTFHPGEKQCRFCLAKPTCRALAADSLKTASEDFSVIGEEFSLRDIKKLTNEEIGLLMGRIPLMLIWANSVNGYGFDELSAGRSVLGYKLVTGKAKNKSFLNKDEPALVSQLLGCELDRPELFTEKLKTPTQLATILKAKKVKKEVSERFDLLWEQKPGDLTIAKESDKREAKQPLVHEDFKAVDSKTLNKGK